MKKMKMAEVPMNLMTVPQGWYTATAISADLNFEYGLAKLFNDTFNWSYKIDDVNIGNAIVVDSSIAIVVKENANDKVSSDNLYDALCNLREVCEERGVTRLAIPKICCGNNGLKWKEVKHMIREIFHDSHMFILVCVQ